jgi:hypothetical protein
VAGVEPKMRQDITPMPDADPLLGSAASAAVRYLVSLAMTAVATTPEALVDIVASVLALVLDRQHVQAGWMQR